MLKYVAFKWAILFLSPLPLNVGYFLSDRIGDVCYLMARGSRRTVRRNLAQVMGPATRREDLDRAARTAFHNISRNYFDLIRLPRLNLDKLSRELTLYHMEHYENALAQKKGVVVVTAHIGNFDFVAQILAARTQKLTVPVEPLQPERLFRLVTGLRSSKGLSFLPQGVAGLRTAVRALKQGETVAVACDRDITGNGCRLNFMGKEASFPTGAVELALKTGALIVPAFSVRQPHNRFSLYVEPPLQMIVEGDRQQTVRENVRQLVSIMERYVRLHPEQWVAAFDVIWDNQGRGPEMASEPVGV